MLERFRPHKPELSEVDPHSLADTLVVIGKTRLTGHTLKLDDQSRFAVFAAGHILNAGAAKKLILRSESPEGLKLLESYVDELPIPSKSLISKLSSGANTEAKDLSKIAVNSNFGRVALVSVGKLGEETLRQLKDSGISTKSLSLEEEVSKKIADSTTSSIRNVVDVAGILASVLRLRNAAEVRFTKLSPAT